MAAPITDGVVRAAQDGEPAAFRVIYQELAPVVLGYLTAKGVADSEAVTNDVFVAALPRLRELSGGVAGLRTFVMSVAHARMVDDARRRSRQPIWCQYDVVSDLRATASAEHEAMELLGTSRVVELLRDLPPDQREVLVLRVVGDLSVQDVATVIGRSPGAVKQLQHRALRKLRQIVIEQGVTV